MTTQSKKRTKDGQLVTGLDELRSLIVPYTYNGDLNNSGAGRQAKANASGHNMYITGIYLIENAGAAETFEIYDGTVAAGTKVVDIDVVANGEPKLDALCPFGPFTDAGGIFVSTAGASDMSVILQITEDPGVQE
jgi:hypothetical protein